MPGYLDSGYVGGCIELAFMERSVSTVSYS